MMSGKRNWILLLLVTCASALAPVGAQIQDSSEPSPTANHRVVKVEGSQNLTQERPFKRFADRWLAPNQASEIVLDKSLRRPFLFFRNASNQRWQPGRLLIILLMAATVARLFAKNMIAAAAERCRKNFFICLAASFIYTTILLSAARLAFQSEELVPLGLTCMGIVQLSYFVGLALGINIFAGTINRFILPKKTLGYWLSLTVTIVILTAISTIPEIGRLPRLGNRLVVLVAIIGLGGLISDLRKPRNE